MARVNNLTNFLNDVATAIKQKLGDNTPIPASQFDTKIGEIETGGNYQTKSISITTNGNYTQLPDTGFDAMDQVVISVNVPQTGGDVKLFTTEQVMQADPNPSEGDLAVVYREEIQPVQEDSEFSSCIFPDTVVLSEAFSGNINGLFRAVDPSVMFDGMVNMSSSMFRFNGWGESSNINIQYTSQDGITYTRIDGGEELQEFGTTIKWQSGGNPFNSVIGNFMKIGGKYFEGLYKYGTNTDTDISCLGVKFSDLYPTYNENNVLYQYNSNLTDLARLNEDDIYVWTSMAFKIQPESNLYYGQILYKPIEGYSPLNNTNVKIGQMIENNTNYLIAYMTNSPADKMLLHYTGLEFENINILTNEWQSFTVNSSTYYYKILTTMNPTEWVANYRYSLFSMGKSGTNRPYTFVKTGSTATTTSGDYWVTPIYGTSTKYFYAPTQLTLKNTNELLPNITAYGKNGVVTGDGSIYNNLDNGYILQNIYNLPQINPTLYGYNIKSTAVPNNINIPKAKGCYIKPSTYANNALFDVSNVIKTGSTNYLSNSGNYYVNNKIVYDSSTHESVRDLGQIYMLGYYNGCVLYTKEQVQPTVSSIIYKYDIDNNTEVSIGSTAAISSSYNWTYKYTHFLVLGNILICDANGENNSPKLIAANSKVCNLDTGVECVIYNHQNTISSGSNLGYSVTPILVSDNKLVIFERFKNSSGSYIYYMYDYTINTNTLLVKANATTTQLIRSSTNYMYKEGYCIVDNYAIVVQDSYAYALNISQPTAMISISSDSALKTCIVNYKDGSIPYTYDSVTTRWRCVTNITYNGATNLSFTFGDYLPFGNNCPLYTLEGTSIGLISSADAVTYAFDSVNSKYIATSKKGNIIGINMNVEPYILTTTNDASRYVIDGNADSSSHYKLLSVFDII